MGRTRKRTYAAVEDERGRLDDLHDVVRAVQLCRDVRDAARGEDLVERGRAAQSEAFKEGVGRRRACVSASSAPRGGAPREWGAGGGGGIAPGARARIWSLTPPNLMYMSRPSPQTVRFWNRQTVSMFFIAANGQAR